MVGSNIVAIAAEAASSHRRWSLPAHTKARARIFILHGTHEHSGGAWVRDLAAACNANAIEAFSFDFCGHGVRKDRATPAGHFGAMDNAVAEATALVAAETRFAAPLPLILFGHSLGSLVCFLLAHELATRPDIRASMRPDLVVLSGFAMDSLSPPFGVKALTPVLRALPSTIHAIVRVLAKIQPQGPAAPLPTPEELTRDQERAQLVHDDPLYHCGWIQNITGLALMDGRKRCQELVASWGGSGRSAFACLLIHGGDDDLCPRSACDTVMAKAPQADKTLKVYPGLLHEVLNAPRRDREGVVADVVAWIEERLPAAARDKAPRAKL